MIGNKALVRDSGGGRHLDRRRHGGAWRVLVQPADASLSDQPDEAGLLQRLPMSSEAARALPPIGAISQGATLDEPSPAVTATVYLACCW